MKLISEAQLVHFFQEDQYDVQIARHPRELTVGIEQEFFLLGDLQQPCSLADSQRFFGALIEGRWTAIFGKGPDDVMIVTCVFILRGSLRMEIKYEHDPHIIEFTAGPTDDLHLLEGATAFCWDAVISAGVATGLILDFTPQRPEFKIDEPRSKQIEALMFYRSRVLGEVGRDSLFSDTIIATHVHIGGLPWLQKPNILKSLYLQEPSAHLVLEQAAGLKDDRWLAYLRAFRPFPLVGFPNLPDWTFIEWAKSLCQMPVMDPCLGEWSGLTLKDVPMMPFSSIFPQIRDFQLVKPRLGGTIEFRASRAQPNVEGVLAVAALRLGLASVCLAGKLPDGDFSAARISWWEQVSTGKGNSDEAALELAIDGLRLRQLDEEHFLSISAKA